MSEYEKGYADGFNARKAISVLKINGRCYCGNCAMRLDGYKAKGYNYCPYCGVKLREQG